MIIILTMLIIISMVVIGVLNHPAFGQRPKNERLNRIKRSKNWQNGHFVNYEDTKILTVKNRNLKSWVKLFSRPENAMPKMPIKAVKTDLNTLDLTKDQMVWFGHSSYLLILNGKKILVDPVLTLQFPVKLMMKPFPGSDLYKPEDIPAIDYLIITHDHWDHLDYGTLKSIRERVKYVICPLGVGAYLEYWGYDNKKIIEMDWEDEYVSPDKIRFTCLTARHYSGRLSQSKQTLWASYMIEASKVVFVGGDSGYGKHFAAIGERFPKIDMALLEAGQYNVNWAQIHLLPDELPKVIHDLKPRMVIPVHNSKFSLAPHDWEEPMRKIIETSRNDATLHVTMPTIGKPVYID